MGLALFETERQEKLAGPTSAIPSRPDPLRTVQWVDELSHDEIDEVTAIVDQAISLTERHPRSPAAMARLAHAQLATSRPGDARRSARKAVELAAMEQDVPGLVAAVQVLSAVGDSVGAEAALTGDGGRAFPHLYARFAIDRGDWETALARLAGLGNLAAAGLRGWIHLQLGQYASAVRNLREAITSGPASPDVYVNLGYAHAALGTLKKAIRATRTATALSPSNRTAAFNLAAFYAVSGEPAEALSVLSKLRQLRPHELSVRLAMAGVHSAIGDYVSAERVLQSAVSDESGWGADPHDRAALRANLASLRRVQGKLSLDDARRKIRQALVEAEYADLGIARLLTSLYTRSTDAGGLAQIVDELSRRHNSPDLAAFRSQLAFLELRFNDALDESRLWAERSPFDSPAAITLTYLLAEVAGDYESAVREGLQALGRCPSDDRLRNNVVYALIRSKRLVEARRLLYESRGGDHNEILLPTAGLLALVEGDIERGISLYERAAERAGSVDDTELVDLIHYCLAAECERVGVEPPYDKSRLRERLQDDPRLQVRSYSDCH